VAIGHVREQPCCSCSRVDDALLQELAHAFVQRGIGAAVVGSLRSAGWSLRQRGGCRGPALFLPGLWRLM
jgi:hypothetical protein